MDLELNGKTALVTGRQPGDRAGGRAGAGTRGGGVALCSRKAADLEDAAARVRQATAVQALCVPRDLSTLRRRDRRGGEDARVASGGIDILVNNAGAIRGGDFLKIPDEQWSEDWSLKLLGLHPHGARGLSADAAAGRRAASATSSGPPARNPTPAYLHGRRRQRRADQLHQGPRRSRARPANILVTAVSPAATAHRALERHDQGTVDGDRQDRSTICRPRPPKAYALGRIATPEDVADLVAASSCPRGPHS